MRIYFILFLICNLSVQAAKIEESYFIHSNSSALKKTITSNPSLVLDHPTKKGFELYGPKGLGEYLKTLNVKYTELNKIEGRVFSINQRSYPKYEEVVQRLKATVAKFPKIMKLISIGKSVQGRDLWMVKISDNVQLDEVEPEFKYISSMHGDEIVGRELMQNLIEDLGSSYHAGDKEIVNLVNNTEIYIMPSMNPDGSEVPMRGNANHVDLNRNFPNPFAKLSSTHSNGNRGGGFQGGRNRDNSSVNLKKHKKDNIYKAEPETQAVMQFQEERNFSLSANFHGGAVVFVYPWDSIYDKHPLNDFLVDISIDYSKLNSPMWNSTVFPEGIINGAEWYIVKGGMQDWSYIVHNDLQFTIELSDVKYPNSALIPKFYKENKQALISFMQYIFQGAGFKWENKRNVKGFVDIISDNGRNLGRFPWKNGEFYKVLPVGKYQYSIYNHQGTFLKKIPVTVNQSEKPSFVRL